MSRKRKNNTGIPDFEIDSLARALLTAIQKLFETEEGKALLASLGIEGEYEGVGHCIVGYPDGELPAAKPRKENWVYYVK